MPYHNIKTRWLLWLLPTPGNIIFTLLIISGVLYAQSAGAIPLTMTNAPTATNVLIPYQGRLTDPAGNLLSGPQVMTFALYNVETGGEPLWTEHRTGDANSVLVTDGLFNVMLGEVTSLAQSIITNNSVLYLGITIGSNSEVSPRVEWGHVPYAVHALTVPDGSITASKLAAGAVTQEKAPTLIKSLAFNNEIILRGNQVFNGTDDNGFVTIEYGHCFPSGVGAFLAVNGHWDANHITVAGHNGPSKCNVQVKMSSATGNRFRLNWIAIGN